MNSIAYVITAYNAESTIGSALNSLLDQARLPDRVVVVDDGSDDSTQEHIEPFLRDLPLEMIAAGRVGRAAALNIGINRATEDLVAILDADDVAIASRTRIHLDQFALDSRLAIQGGAFLQVARGASVRRRRMPSSNEEIRRRLAFSGPFCHSTVAYRRRALIESGGFRTDLRTRIDQDIWTRIAANGWRLRNVDATLAIHWKAADTYFASANTTFYRAGSMLTRNVSALYLLGLPKWLVLPAVARVLYSLIPHAVTGSRGLGAGPVLSLDELTPAEMQAFVLMASRTAWG